MNPFNRFECPDLGERVKRSNHFFLCFISGPIIFALFLFFLASCSKTQDYKFLTIEKESLYNLITQTYGIKALKYNEFSGDVYSIPDIKWINGKFTPFFGDFLFKYNITQYKDFSNDCGKFVNYGLTCGYILYNREKNAPPNTSLAIGEYSYIHWTMVIHSIIVFAAHDNGQIKLVFYEPQFQRIIELNENQKACVSWSL